MRGIKLLVTVVVGVAVVAGTSAPAAAEYPDANAVCEDVQQEGLVAVFADGLSVTPDGSVSLYPGTEFRLILCTLGSEGWFAEPTGSAWDLTSVDGLETVGTNPNSVTVRVAVEESTGPAGVDLSDDVEGRESVPAPSLIVFPGHVTARSVNGTEVELRFASEQRREAFAAAADDYEATAEETRTIAARLNESDPTEVDNLAKQTREDAEALNESIAALNDSHDDLEEELFATVQGPGTGAVTALEAYESAHEATVRDARRAARNREQQLARAARRNAEFVLLNFGLTGLVGVAIGAGAGWYVTKGRLEEVAYERSRTSAVDFHPNQVRDLALAGLGLVVLALASLPILLGIENILSVLMSVI